MGKSDRVRRQLIEQGKEKLFRHEKTPEQMVMCKNCKAIIPQSKMAEHCQTVYHQGKRVNYEKVEVPHVEAIPGPAS